MNCPVCKTSTLVMAEKQGIEIDYCPQCRGVWLDRGELDKIVERSLQINQPQSKPVHDFPKSDSRHFDSDYYRSNPYGKKKKGFLGDIFDFD